MLFRLFEISDSFPVTSAPVDYYDLCDLRNRLKRRFRSPVNRVVGMNVNDSLVRINQSPSTSSLRPPFCDCQGPFVLLIYVSDLLLLR